MQCKDEYLDGVLGEIKFKAARKYLRRELGEHIDDKAQELTEEGVADAEAAAVAVMGDAKETGRALNAVHKPRTEWGVIVCIILLSLAGVAAAFAGPGHKYVESGEMIWPVLQSTLVPSLLIGFFLMAGMYFFNYSWLLRLRRVLFGTAFLLIACFTAVTVFLPSSYDSYWQAFSFSSLFIGYISPLFFMLGSAGFIQNNRDKGFKGAAYVSIFCALSIFAVYSQTSGALYLYPLAIVYITIMLVSTLNNNHNKKWLHFVIVFGSVIAMLGLCMFLTYAQAVETGSIDMPNSNVQIVQEMLKGAKLVGASPQFVQTSEWYYLGSSSEYLIIAVIVEFGWLAGIGIVLAFTALFAFMMCRSLNIADPFGRLLASGIAVLFFARFALFILTCTGLIGNMPVILPFVNCSSYYPVDALLAGLFLSVWRRSSFMKGPAPAGVSAGTP